MIVGIVSHLLSFSMARMADAGMNNAINTLLPSPPLIDAFFISIPLVDQDDRAGLCGYM